MQSSVNGQVKPFLESICRIFAPTGLLPSAPQKGVVHCMYSIGEAELQLLAGGEMVLGEE